MNFVKKLIVPTILSCIAVGACSLFGGTAFADEGNSPFYPSSFTKHVSEEFGNITDYAVNGNTFAFSSVDENGTQTISVVKSGIDRVNYSVDFTVMGLDFNGEVFYYSDSNGTVYDLPEKKATEDKRTFRTFSETTIGNFYYYLDNGLNIYNRTSKETVTLNGFVNIKVYGEEQNKQIYALKDGKFYTISESSASLADISYTDYSDTENIPAGDAVDRIKTFNLNMLYYVTLKGGYMSEIDSGDMNGTFKVKNTVKIGSDGAAVGKEALLLCTVGENNDVSVIAYDGKTYITASGNLSVPQQRDVVTAEFNTATVSAHDYAFSAPFKCENTKLFLLPSGVKVKIIGKVEGAEFYKIMYLDESGIAKIGYVPYRYVSQFDYFEGEPSKTEDKDYTESDLVRTVVLVLIVIVLVVAALWYLAYIALPSKKKNSKSGTSPAKKQAQKEAKKKKREALKEAKRDFKDDGYDNRENDENIDENTME